MIIHFDPADSGTSDFRVRFLSSTGGVNLSPRLVPLDKAKPGDLVAMVSLMALDVYGVPGHDHRLEVFYMRGVTGLETRFYRDLTGNAADNAAHLVAEEVFMGPDLHRIVSSLEMVEHPEVYVLHVVHFADAVFYIDSAWLHGHLFEDDEECQRLNPVVVKMGRVGDREAAMACVAKTRRYLGVFRSMQPAQYRDEADWSIKMPLPEAFLE